MMSFSRKRAVFAEGKSSAGPVAHPPVSAVTSQIPFATVKKERPPPWAPPFRALSSSSHLMPTIMETHLAGRLWHGWRRWQPFLQGSQCWSGGWGPRTHGLKWVSFYINYAKIVKCLFCSLSCSVHQSRHICSMKGKFGF